MKLSEQLNSPFFRFFCIANELQAGNFVVLLAALQRRMKTNPKGNLNIPLGETIEVVQREAGRIGVSKTELGRLLIVHGTELLAAGRLVFSPPALKEQAGTD